jgi:putative Mg2+ transporter-C (MgtC) family protein
MNWMEFLARLAVAQILGAAIGVERQWRQRMAGLRTNALVSTGAALFVMLGSMIPGENSPTRVVSYVVSGVGFLGGGVIPPGGLHRTRIEHGGDSLVCCRGRLPRRMGLPS